MASVPLRRFVVPYVFGARGMRIEGVIAGVAIVLLVVTLATLWRGRAALALLDLPIALHLVTLLPALVLTPFLFLGDKGATTHRVLGYTWCALMLSTAGASMFIRSINPTGFTWVHIFAITTFVSTPRLILNARGHRWRVHRWVAIGLTSGALLLAGVTAYIGDRHLGTWFNG